MSGAEGSAERVLVLAPVGRDAALICERIVAEGMACEVCEDLPALLAGIEAGAGAVVVAQEALAYGGAQALLSVLEAQEPWSDVPVLLLVELPARRRSRTQHVITGSGFERANVTLLQRPLGMRSFVSSVRSAVRARRRQYQLRDLHRELERAVRLSDMFVGILGHDLRSPLSAITMAAQLVIHTSAEATAQRPAGRILTSAGRMARMIEQLLDFARARQGHGIPIFPTATHLGALCRRTVQELEAAYPDAVLRLTETGDLGGVWDVDRLAQVVSNLVGNAVQHGTRGEPVRIDVDGTDVALVRVRVHNAGSIPAHALPRLFEPFTHAPTKASRSGLGLGLFIVREIARAHGGEIHVRCEDDCSTFEVTLPRKAHAAGSGALATSQPSG